MVSGKLGWQTVSALYSKMAKLLSSKGKNSLEKKWNRNFQRICTYLNIGVLLPTVFMCSGPRKVLLTNCLSRIFHCQDVEEDWSIMVGRDKIQ